MNSATDWNDVASSAAARCTAGLLTWNPGEGGERCVASLLAQSEPLLRVDWIDNASADGAPDRLRGRFPALPPPEVNPRNLGFCAPHNRMLARCATPYYLALNQDVELAPDYVARLCDWMDSEPGLALVAGVTLRPPSDPARPAPGNAIDSAGLAFPRARYLFHLGAGRLYGEPYLDRRRVSGVEGSALIMRVADCRRAIVDGPGEVFPESFFAYYEEVDLTLRLARLGLGCGVDGRAVAVHAGKGSGGFGQPAIRTRFLANHWLTTLRNEPWGLILRDLPWILRGEARYWLPEYLAAPSAFARALAILAREAPAARRAWRRSLETLGPGLAGLASARRLAVAETRQDSARRVC
jgi:GT2 family glycosyltransferase